MNDDTTPDSTADMTRSADDELLDALRLALDSLPERSVPADFEVPPEVLAGATWVHDWHNLDAELAELEFDSEADRELAGVRSGGGALREMTFVADGRRLEVEIEPGHRSARISGTVEPPVTGAVHFVVGGEMFSAPIDEHGHYAVDDVALGTVLAFVDTSNGRIRLGAFEL